MGIGIAGSSGCGSPPRALDAPAIPSTHRDPPAAYAPPHPAPRTGDLFGIVASSGDEQARALLVSLVIGVRDGDVEAVASVLAPEVFALATLRIPRARHSGTQAEALARQLVIHARLAQLPPSAAFDELIDVRSIEVEPIARAFEGELPHELRPGDRIVRFELAPAGQRPFAILSGTTRAQIVVRTGEDACIVAR
jgi:hypothetical protein